MKIRIEFNNEEKEIIARGIDVSLENDRSERMEGRFGLAEYNKDENYIQFDIVTGFIKAYIQVIASIKGMITSFVSTFELFSDTWLDDIKTTYPDEKEEPEEEIDRLKKEAMMSESEDDIDLKIEE